MQNRSMTILLGAALVVAGYLLGGVADHSGTSDAHASPLWDAAKGAYVTGDASSLTFWKVKDGDVLEARTVTAKDGELTELTARPAALPAAGAARPAGSGDGKSCGSCGGGGSCG